MKRKKKEDEKHLNDKNISRGCTNNYQFMPTKGGKKQTSKQTIKQTKHLFNPPVGYITKEKNENWNLVGA